MFKNNSLISVNFHLIKNCNEKCMYCYARFNDKPIETPLDIDQVNKIITLLRNNGTEKITFAGGEPTLFQHLGDALMHAKRIGMVTSIVTNGARLENLLENYGRYIDWVALSIDSTYENIQQNLGRGNGSYIRKCIKLASMCHRMKIKLKMNTVITNLNYKEDFSELIKIIQPRRWKIFQVLPIIGQNDGDVDELLVDSDKFQEFISKNQHLENDKLQIVPENNDAMTGSYVMIDPEGRFFSNVDGTYLYSSPILVMKLVKGRYLKFLKFVLFQLCV